MIELGDCCQYLQCCTVVNRKKKTLTTVKNYRAVNPPGDCGDIINYKSKAQVALYSHHNPAMEL